MVKDEAATARTKEQKRRKRGTGGELKSGGTFEYGLVLCFVSSP